MRLRFFSGGKLLAGLLTLSLFPSCIDVTEELWINPDGSGRMKIEMGMSAQMAAMAKLGGNQAGGGNPFGEAESQLSDDSNVESFEVKQETRGDMLYYVMDASVKDLSDTVEKLANSTSDGPLGASGQGMMLTLLENGNYRFVQPLDFQSANGGAGNTSNPLAAGMVATMFQGRYMTIRIHGNIVSSNGTIAEDGKSAEWKIALADAVAGRIDLEQAEAEIRLGSGFQINPKLLMTVLGVIGVFLIAVIAFTIGKKSRPA